MPEEQNYPDTQETVQRNIIQSDRPSLVREIKSDTQIEEIWHKLLGERYDGKTWKKDPELENDSLTQLGAWEISKFAQYASSINTQVSKLKKEEIEVRICFRMREFVRKIAGNLKRYGIRNEGMLADLKSFIFTNDWVVLSQGEGGHITRLLKNTVDEKREISTEQRNQKKKILGFTIPGSG